MAFKFNVASTSDQPPDKNCAQQILYSEPLLYRLMNAIIMTTFNWSLDQEMTWYKRAADFLLKHRQMTYHYAWDRWGHTSLQQGECVLCNLLRGCPLRGLCSSGNHAWLQQNALKQRHCPQPRRRPLTKPSQQPPEFCQCHGSHQEESQVPKWALSHYPACC